MPDLLTAWVQLDRTERIARLRSLSMGARLLAGSKADALVAALRRAETDDAALATAGAALERLPTLTSRRLLTTFLGLVRP